MKESANHMIEFLFTETMDAKDLTFDCTILVNSGSINCTFMNTDCQPPFPFIGKMKKY